MRGRKFYLKQKEEGTFIGVNTFFEDSPSGKITLIHPANSNKILSIDVNEAIKITSHNKNYWLNELSKVIAAEESGEAAGVQNLDIIYEGLQNALHLEEQIRAKLMNSSGIAKLNETYSYHPRLYSAWSRLASFINYGNTKYSSLQLAELGFYNKTDMLQDLAFYENPDVPIPVAEDPNFSSERDVRSKLFPFSRVERGLPSSNVPLSAVANSLLHQSVS